MPEPRGSESTHPERPLPGPTRSGRRWMLAVPFASLVLLVGWTAAQAWTWQLPDGYEPPPVPEHNPMSEAKVELGRHLFYDTRLSEDGSQSCSWCHRPWRAFTEGLTRSRGITGQVHPRNAPTLVNLGYARALNWAEPELTELEVQALGPMLGTDPVELGMGGLEDQLVRRLSADTYYRLAFAEAFPDELEPIALPQITKALSAFQRSLISLNSPYDRYRAGDEEALTPAARRGLELFQSDRLQCATCHVPPFFTSVAIQEDAPPPARYINTGLYHLDDLGSYRERNQGLAHVTNRDSDRGRFKAPTLRNIQVTSPYMHDGSINSLNGVLDHYAAGGRTIENSTVAGVGSTNPNKSPLIRGFTLSPTERSDLLAFLRSLTDRDFLTDPDLRDPWPAKRKKKPIP